MQEKDNCKNGFRLVMMVVLFLVAAALSAQPSMEKQRYRIDYVNESHLLRKGDMITVLQVDLEMPKRLGGLPTTALQKYLCQLLFGNRYADFDEGWKSFREGLGEEIRQMPDEEGLKKRYVNLVLHALAWEKDRFVSLQTSRTYRHGNQTDSVRNEMLTYDIVADNVLRIKDIVKKLVLNQMDPDVNIVQSILQYMPQNNTTNNLTRVVNDIDYIYQYGIYFPQNLYNIIDVDALPDEACLMPMGVLFNVPCLEEDGKQTFSIIPYDVMSPHMKPSARKTFLGKSKRRTDKPETTVPMKDNSLMADSMLVYDFTSTMPAYDGDTKEMLAFIYREVDYPSYEALLGIQGKVQVSFVVERDGSLSSPSVISPVSPGIDREAVAAIMAMRKWKPGLHDGVPVRVRTVLPVSFKIQGGKVLEH